MELSCGAGPSHVVLEPGLPLLLDCSLGTSDIPFNVTWLQNGQPLPLQGDNYLQYLANGSLLLLATSKDEQPNQDVEGAYSCVSASGLGALTSRTVNVLLASRCSATTQTSWFILGALVSYSTYTTCRLGELEAENCPVMQLILSVSCGALCQWLSVQGEPYLSLSVLGQAPVFMTLNRICVESSWVNEWAGLTNSSILSKKIRFNF